MYLMSRSLARAATTAGLVLFTILVVLPDPAAGQGPGGRMGGGRGPGGMPRPNFDPVLFDGPPVPEEMVDLVQLEPAQYEPYAGQYRIFMQETKAVRDSVLEMRRLMRDMMGQMGGAGASGKRGSRDRGKMEARRLKMEAMQKQMQTLERHQKAFDENLKSLLSREQFKNYERWRQEQRKTVEGRPETVEDGRRR